MEPSSEPDPRRGGCFYAVGSHETAVFRFERLEPPNYRVMEQFEYVDEPGYWYRVPKDTADNETDFASIPVFLTWLVPKDGAHTPAAVLHDALIGGEKDVHYETSAPETVPDRHADYLFREAMKATGVAWLRRWLMWAAVILRTLTHGFDPVPGTDEVEVNKRWWRIVVIGAAIAVWAVLAAAMALDVPDLLTGSLPGWLDWIPGVGWIGDRPFLHEVGLALLLVAGGAVAMAVVFGLALGLGRSFDDVQRGAAAGAIGGVVVGFLGLPMLASLVGAAGYFVLEKGLEAVLGRRSSGSDDGSTASVIEGV